MQADLLYLVPELTGKPGGIARYCRHICNAVTEAGLSLHVIALTDKTATAENANSSSIVKYDCCASSKRRFVRKALCAATFEQPKLVLAGHVNFAPLAYLAARIVNAPLCTFIYGIDVFERLPLLRRIAFRTSAMALAISQFTAAQAVSANHFTEGRIRILHNCLDAQFAQEVNEANNKGSEQRVRLSLLTVARMSCAEQYKGHDYVIRSLPQLLAKFPSLVYDIVGGGDWQPALAHLARQYNVDHVVRFHGIVSDVELKRLYEEATIFVMPSRREGFGFVFLEAMARGVPVIGGNLDATPEVIVDGQTGYVIDPTSINEIVNAVTHLLENEALRKQMGQAGIQHVNDKFSYTQFQQSLSGYLAELMR